MSAALKGATRQGRGQEGDRRGAGGGAEAAEIECV